MRSDQSIYLAGCQSDAYEVVRNALSHVGFRVARAELDELISNKSEPDCFVFYITSDNSNCVRQFLSQSALAKSRRIAVVDARDKAIHPVLEQLDVRETLYKPVQLSRLVAAIDHVLGNNEMPASDPANEIAAAPDTGNLDGDAKEISDGAEDDDEEANRAHAAWAIEQYQKRHGQELSPDAWKQMMLERLNQDNSRRSKRQMRLLGVAILCIIMAIIVLILFKMNRTMDAQINEQLILRQHR